MQVLLVEDDTRLAEALERIVGDAGYHVEVVHDGADGLACACNGAYDVVILDVMLPSLSGFDIVAGMRRAQVATPVLMLTARGTVPDKIRGLDSGADDYMTKPFSPAELLAHLRALTRRRGEVLFEEVSVGDLTLRLDSADLTCKGKKIHLSAKEFELARIFLTNPAQILSKEQLRDKVWGFDASVEENSVEAYVSFLRKKIRYVGSTARIESLRMQGYRLVTDGDQGGVHA